MIIWIIMAVSEITLDAISTGIIHGTCVPWGAYRSYAEQKAMAIFTYTLTGILPICRYVTYTLTYLLPVVMMVICYARIVYVLTHKVTVQGRF